MSSPPFVSAHESVLATRALSPDAHAHGADHEPLRTLRRLVAGGRGELRALVVYAIGSGVFSLAVPVVAQALMETVAFTGVLPQIVVLAGLAAVAMLASLAMSLAQVFLVEWMSRRVFVRTFLEGTERILRAPTTLDADALVRRAARFYDVVSVEKAMASLATDGVAVALQVGLGLGLLALYHPLLLALGLAIVVLLALVVLPVASRALTTARKESLAKHEAAAFLLDLARRESNGRGDAVKRAAGGHADQLARSWMEARSAHFRLFLWQLAGVLFIQVSTSIVVLSVGGWLVISGELTLGQLAAAEVVVALTVGAIARGGKLLAKAYDVVAATEKLETLLHLEREDDEGSLVDGRGGAALEIATQGTSSTISIAAGTVARLDPVTRDALVDAVRARLDGRHDSLRVLVDGIDLRACARSALRDRVVVVDDLPIPAGTVRASLSVLSPLSTTGEMAAALEAVGLGALVFAHPLGLERSVRDLMATEPNAEDALRLASLLVARPRVVVFGASSTERSGAILARVLDAWAEDAERPTIVLSDGSSSASAQPSAATGGASR